jgi:ferric enterobactin receptor
VNVLLQAADSSSIFEPRSFRRGSIENNNLKDAGFKLENTLALGPRHQAEFGVEATSLDVAYNYQVESGDEGDAVAGRRVLAPRNLVGIMNRRDKGLLWAGYLQDRWTPSDRLTLTPGLRVTSFDRTGSIYWEPRFSMSYRLTDRIKATASWGRFYQFVSDATREDIIQGSREFWALSDGQGIPVGSATHYIAGLSYETEDVLVDVERFYKDLAGLSEFAPRIVRATPGQDYSQYFYTESGTAKGIEFLLQKKSGRYTGWISYTLSRVEYEAPLLSSNPFPALQDQTHEFKIVNFLELGKLTLSGTWIYATGKPYTPPLGVDQALVGSRLVDRVVIGDKNSARLPEYHRLDLSATYDLKVFGLKSKLGLTLFNVYDRKNVWYREFDIQQHELVQNDIQFMGFVINLFLDVKF